MHALPIPLNNHCKTAHSTKGCTGTSKSLSHPPARPFPKIASSPPVSFLPFLKYLFPQVPAPPFCFYSNGADFPCLYSVLCFAFPTPKLAVRTQSAASSVPRTRVPPRTAQPFCADGRQAVPVFPCCEQGCARLSVAVHTSLDVSLSLWPRGLRQAPR